MPEAPPSQIVVSANAGVNDTLAAAARYLVIVVGAVPVLLKLLGDHDFVALVNYFRGTDGVALVSAAGALGALVWGLYKTHKRGSQIGSVAQNPAVSDQIATTK